MGDVVGMVEEPIVELIAEEIAAEQAVTDEVAKPYVFRKLNASDLSPMIRILSKIGINNFADCLQADSVKELLKSFSDTKTDTKVDTEIDTETGTKDEQDNSTFIMGVGVALEVANVIFAHLPACEQDIFHLLSRTSNLSEKKISELDMNIFLEMVIDFIKKEEFKGFIKVASKLMKSGK